MKILKEKLKKLQDSRKLVKIIGYEVGTKGYKCYDWEKCKVHISQDVTYEEKIQLNGRISNIEKKEGTFYSTNFFDIDEEQLE